MNATPRALSHGARRFSGARAPLQLSGHAGGRACTSAYGVAAEKVWIVVGNGYRGVYNSAWIGMLMTICCSTFLSLVGFYIVKNSVQRDTDTRVGQILAATPMRKDFYTLAKTLSNFAVLACMVVVLMLAALVMQLHARRGPLFLYCGSCGRPSSFLHCPPCCSRPPALRCCSKPFPCCVAESATSSTSSSGPRRSPCRQHGLDDPTACNFFTAAREALCKRSTRSGLEKLSIQPSPSAASAPLVPSAGMASTGRPTYCSCVCSGSASPLGLALHGFRLLSSLRSSAILAQAACTAPCVGRIVRGRTREPRSSHPNRGHASHAVAPKLNTLPLPAASHVRTPADAQRPALVVVRRRRRIAHRPTCLSRSRRSCRFPARSLDLAHPPLVANGMPRVSSRHRSLAVLLRAQPARDNCPLSGQRACSSPC